MIVVSILAASAIAQAGAAAAIPTAPADVPPVAGAGSNIIAYPAAFFAGSRPTSAFDMIQRLPGFSLSGGDNVRGFAGSGGNVLINGQRPTSKSVMLEVQLRRIPANTVERIELIRGGAPGIDMMGQTLVANIIRSTNTVSTTAITLGFRPYTNGWIGPRGGIEWSQRRGDLSLEGSASVEVRTSFSEGGDGLRLLYAPNGALRESAPFKSIRRGPVIAVNGGAELDKGDNIYRLNAGWNRTDEEGYDRYLRYSPAGAFLGQQYLNDDLLRDTFELGGDYERLFAGGVSARILALQTVRKEKVVEDSQQPGANQTSDRRQTSGESIVRGTLAATFGPSLNIEGGAEGVFNFLDAASAVTRNAAAVIIPNANLRVEERRGEVFTTATWKPLPRFTVEGGLRIEASKISSSGDTNNERSFRFFKPRLLVSYSPPAVLSQMRVRVERTVGQLNFSDFVASAELATGTATAGNANLEPERAWVFEATLERRFWGRGALVLAAEHQEVQAVVDRIPINRTFDAPGNIGSGRRDKIGLDITLPFDRLGVRGARLTSSLDWRWSEVTDPVTGQPRRISSERAVNGNLRFTHDVARLRSTYGAEILMFGAPTTSYRINEIRRNAEDSYLYAYWDYKPDPTVSFRIEGRLLGDREFRRYRTRYTGSRALGIVAEYEDFKYTLDPYLSIFVRKVL